MSTLIIRDLHEGIGLALKSEASKRMTSVNKLVHQYIAAGLQRERGGLPNQKNDLQRFAGVWSAKQRKEFEAATQSFGEIEAEIWT